MRSKLIFILAVGLILIFIFANDKITGNFLKKKDSGNNNTANTVNTQLKDKAGNPSSLSKINLLVTEPLEGETVTNSAITIKGVTNPNATVFINEKEIKADSNGNFMTSLVIEEGENLLVIIAHDEYGNYIEKELAINMVSVN